MGEVAPADPTAALHVRVSQLRRALADFADEEFARVAVARWEEQRLAAVEAYAEARLDLGDIAIWSASWGTPGWP